MFLSQSISTYNPAVQKSDGVSPILAMNVSISEEGIMSGSLACLIRSRALFARERLSLVLEDSFFFPNASNRESRVSSGKWSLLRMIKRAT